MANHEFNATVTTNNGGITPIHKLPRLKSHAAAFLDLSSEVIVHTGDLVAWYEGTRAALEAEGFIPTATRWPSGFDDLQWSDDKHTYKLCRRRPEGVKGPRKQFIDADWWWILITPHNAKHWNEFAIERKSKALQDEIFSQSAKGRAELNKRWKQYWQAACDEEFQAFKALIPGLIPPVRQRRQKTAAQDSPQQ